MKNKKILLLQSNYLPWVGYFDLINNVDEFVIYDCVQYTKNDWRNRNKIKTNIGESWLTIPIKTKSRSLQTIEEAEVLNSSWVKNHWFNIQTFYGKAAFFNHYKNDLESLFKQSESISSLSEINELFIRWVCGLYGINTKITRADKSLLAEGKSQSIINVCVDREASVYLTGPSAEGYLNKALFVEKGITVEVFEYPNYASYKQLNGDFIPGLSVLDSLLNNGNAPLWK